MKKIINSGIVFLFIIVFLLLDAIAYQMINQENDPQSKECQENNQILQDYQELLNQKEMKLPETTSASSKVLFRDPFLFFNEITILKGSEENILKNSAVINQKGLLGIVTDSTKHTSKVKLLTNIDTKISVKVKDAYGILSTNNKRENWIDSFTKEVTLQVGDPVFTSGLTEVPGNILIGFVEEITKDPLGLTQSVKIKRVEDLNEINFVVILTKEKVE